MVNFLFSAYFGGHFCCHSNGKSQSNLRLLHFGYCSSKQLVGAQWLSGSVLDSRPKGLGFKPHRCLCVVSLSKNINPSEVLVQPKKTCPFITERLLMGRKELNQTNKKEQIGEKQFYILAS